jgi:hypothetical protein
MRHIQRLYYDDFWNSDPPPGLYVFCDQDMLSKRERARLGKICDRLEADPEHYTCLNHPDRFVERYDLLRTLHERGINPFRVYNRLRVTDETQYPVIIRCRWDGMSAPSPLLHSHQQVKEYARKVKRPRDHFAVEFYDTSDEEGTFRKFGAFCVGDQVIPRHILFSKKWMLKYPDEIDDRRFAEELAFVRSNQFADEIRLAFRIAGVDYGRIDFAIKDGKPVIWEINTNPVIKDVRDPTSERQPLPQIFLQRLLASLEALLPPAVASKALDLELAESLELEASLG